MVEYSKSKESIEPPQPEPAPYWMVTYGDMMGLILTFFIILISFSTIEVGKYRAATGSIRGALQRWTPDQGGRRTISKIPMGASEQPILESAEQIINAVEANNLSQWIELYHTAEGIRIILSDPVIFDVGKDVLKPQIMSILRILVQTAISLRISEVVIEGHTDDTPIHNERFPSNWELSSARALQVVKTFQRLGFPPERLMGVGYGEFRPRKKLPPDAGSEAKAVNRRVEIILKSAKESPGLFSKVQQYQQEGSWGD